MLTVAIGKQLEGFTLDVTLDAPEEKIIVLFGPSGSGKSLTMAAIAGLLTPDRGRIAIGERVLFDAAEGIQVEPQERNVGMVRQDLALFPHLTAVENIGYGLGKLPAAERERRITELLRMMRLEGLGKHKPAELSGGQQQRVALARALAIQPAVLLLDEPFSALDLEVRVELRRELKELQRQLKISVVFVTHDLGEAVLLGDTAAIMWKGRILQYGVPGGILRKPVNSEVARIVGVKNILPATVMDERCLRVGEYEMEANTAPFANGAQVMACIRPERVMLVRREGPNRTLPNLLEGDLLDEESNDNTVTLQFRAEGTRLTPTDPRDLEIEVPLYVYERLNLANDRHWLVSIKPNVVHLVAE